MVNKTDILNELCTIENVGDVTLKEDDTIRASINFERVPRHNQMVEVEEKLEESIEGFNDWRLIETENDDVKYLQLDEHNEYVIYLEKII